MMPDAVRRFRVRLAQYLLRDDPANRDLGVGFEPISVAERRTVEQTLDHYDRQADLIEARLRVIVDVRSERAR